MRERVSEWMKMSMWLPREIQLACACVCGQTSDEQIAERKGIGVGSGWLKSPTTREGRGWRKSR